MTLRLFVHPGSAVLLGSIPGGQTHAHLATQLIIAVGESFELTVDSVSSQYRAAVVQSNVPHLLRTPPRGVLTLLLDPTTEAGVADTAIAAGARVRELGPSAVSDVAVMAEALLDRPVTRAEAQELRRATTALLAPDVGAESSGARARSIDRRVRRVLAHLDAHRADTEVWDLPRLAELVALSPERLRHLFRAEVGMPIRSYRRWARIARAVEFLAEGQSLTRAAHSAGFADSGHLSRTFRQVFGVAPSKLDTGGQIMML